MKIQHFQLENLNCSSCVRHLEAMEEDLDGVCKVDANLKRQTMAVSYDESVLSVQGIVAAVCRMGYTAIPCQRDRTRAASFWSKFFPEQFQQRPEK